MQTFDDFHWIDAHIFLIHTRDMNLFRFILLIFSFFFFLCWLFLIIFIFRTNLLTVQLWVFFFHLWNTKKKEIIKCFDNILKKIWRYGLLICLSNIWACGSQTRISKSDNKCTKSTRQLESSIESKRSIQVR